MDPREDSIPRVSLGSLKDWERVKHNHASAARTRLQEVIRKNALEGQEDLLNAHLDQVRWPFERVFQFLALI
jgi:hypothetical protein